MQPSNREIAESFSKHDFETCYPYIAETILWNVIGGLRYEGKQKVTDACNQSSEYLKTARTEFSRFLVVADGNAIVIDSIAAYTDANNKVSKVASCDIYQFNDGKIIGITSYCVELKEEVNLLKQ